MPGRLHSNSRGISLVEILIVMGIFMVLAGASYVNLVKPVNSTNLTTTVDKVITDIKSAQNYSMAGADSAQNHGVYFSSGYYTVFVGATYNATDTKNRKQTFDPQIKIQNITVPGSTLVFLEGSGEISGFSGTSYGLKVVNTQSGESRQININRYGAIEVL